MEAKDHGGLLAPAGEDTRLHRREIPVHRLADELDPLALVELDLGQVRAVEQGAEKLDELLPLRLAQQPPVAGQGAPGDLGEVEEVDHRPADGGLALQRPGFGLERRVGQDLGHLLGGRPQGLGRGSGSRGTREECKRPGQAEDRQATSTHGLSLRQGWVR